MILVGTHHMVLSLLYFLLQEELYKTKEELNRIQLDKEVAEQEKDDIFNSLKKAEVKVSELELEVNRLKTEEAGLR